MEIAKTKEKIPEEEKGWPRGWVERPVKGCSPPNEVARSPPDNAALRMHVARNPRAAARRPARAPNVAKTVERESVLFIGTQFSNLYTAVDTPARGRVGGGVSTVWRDTGVSSTQPERGAGECRRGLARHRSQTSGGREAHGRKNAACRQGCRVAESLVGRGRALVASANHRVAHVSIDRLTSSKMRVGEMRM
jgi:hypothetical protein